MTTAARAALKGYISANGGGFSLAEINALNKVFNEVFNAIDGISDQIGDIQLGDLSGATDGQQLTFEDAGGTWVPGAANPA